MDFDSMIRRFESYQRCQIKEKQVETPVWPEWAISLSFVVDRENALIQQSQFN